MMKYFPVILCLSSVALANPPPPLTNKSLRVDAPNDVFSKCVAEAAISQVLSKNPLTQGYVLQSLLDSGVQEDAPPFKTGTRRPIGIHMGLTQKGWPLFFKTGRMLQSWVNATHGFHHHLGGSHGRGSV